jgi:hypothetical protein
MRYSFLTTLLYFPILLAQQAAITIPSLSQKSLYSVAYHLLTSNKKKITPAQAHDLLAVDLHDDIAHKILEIAHKKMFPDKKVMGYSSDGRYYAELELSPKTFLVVRQNSTEKTSQTKFNKRWYFPPPPGELQYCLIGKSGFPLVLLGKNMIYWREKENSPYQEIPLNLGHLHDAHFSESEESILVASDNGAYKVLLVKPSPKRGQIHADTPRTTKVISVCTLKFNSDLDSVLVNNKGSYMRYNLSEKTQSKIITLSEFIEFYK